MNVLAALDDCGAYVDDAAGFPEQFKPGVVKRHQQQYAKARAAIAELIEATKQLVAESVNPGDGGEYEDGEWRALDRARAALSACGVAK